MAPGETRLRDFEEHFALMEAIVERAPARAEEIMRTHVTASVTARAVEELRS